MRKKTIFLFVPAIVLATVGGSWVLSRGFRDTSSGSSVAQKTPAPKYHCPMHPTMVADHPGDCPICGMRLVPIEESHEEGSAESSATTAPPAGASVQGLSSIRISSSKQQLIGVKTCEVSRAPFRRTIRAVGRVAFDETRLKHIHTKTSGYVERLHANATGELVRRDEPLLEIYSPELLASQQEYVLALRARARTAEKSPPSVVASMDDLVGSARRRLELLDVSRAEVQALEASGQARNTVTLYAPIDGYITQRNVTQGERVEPDMTLLDLADLSRVWILASVYEYELPFVRQGQKASMTLSYLPGKTFEGRVSLIYPVLDAATRTAQVRLEFENPQLLLKPDMYAEVSLEAELGSRLAVPATAVMETGTRSVVFVDKGDGHFEPREVSIGVRLPETYEVLSGLSEGERVLTSANFFVDSESRLRAALSAMAQPSRTNQLN